MDRFKQTIEEYPVSVNKHSETVYRKKNTSVEVDSYSPLDDSLDTSYTRLEDQDNPTY